MINKHNSIAINILTHGLKVITHSRQHRCFTKNATSIINMMERFLVSVDMRTDRSFATLPGIV